MTSTDAGGTPVERALALLALHYRSFRKAVPFARKTGHPVPSDTRGWSQILVSTLTGIDGLKRKKGTDLADGSDVKAANVWEAIDTPRFNGVLKAGTKAKTAGTIESLDAVPYLFFVLWDHEPTHKTPRCRIWCVRPKHDTAFNGMCREWFALRDGKKIVSNNFQLHPPRNKNSDVFRNKCGNLEYPLLFCAERREGTWKSVVFRPEVMKKGLCKSIIGPKGKAEI